MEVADNTEVELLASDLMFTPWRHTVDWTNQEKTADYLKKQLETYVPLHEDLGSTNVRFQHCNILLMGPVGAGKSSFLNTASSTFRGKIFNIARSGCADKSLTTKFSRHLFKSSKSKLPMNFKLCDSSGIETNNLMTKENMRILLEGHLVDNFAELVKFNVLGANNADYRGNSSLRAVSPDASLFSKAFHCLWQRKQFEPQTTINRHSPGFKKKPKLDDKIHCVAIFVDASTIESMPDEVVQNIKDMQTVMNSLDVPQVVILTRVDKVCEKTKEDVSNVYRSQKIENSVAKVSETIGLPRNNVFPMKNYEKEGCVSTSVNILMMYTLKMMLDQADAYLSLKHDEIVKDYKRRGRSQGITASLVAAFHRWRARIASPR